ncbi:MAG: hypothetical protein ABI610_12550 [Acidobacteriota bacterium]
MIAGTSDDRPPVRVRLPEHRLERLLELAERRGLGPQPPLLEDDVPLRVELPEDRLQEPFRLHPHPELELVRRDVDEVAGHVRVGEGVHAGAAPGRVDPVELVLDEDLALLRDERVELLLELAQARRLVLRLQDVVDLAPAPGSADLRVLLPHLVAQLLLLGDDREVLFVVLRADRRRALEHHVLEKVRDPGDARTLVRAADEGDPAARDARLPFPVNEKETHPVRQLLFDDRDLLREERSPEDEAHGDGRNNPAEFHARPFHDVPTGTPFAGVS